MSDTTNYKLTLVGEGFDPEFVIFKLLKNVPESKHYFNENGISVGNGYDWRDMEQPMRDFSVTQPGILFQIIEYGAYDNESFEFRHYFKDGLYAHMEPKVVVTWPEFSEDLLA